MATITAWAARRRTRRSQVLIALLIALLPPLLPAGAAAVGTGILKFNKGLQPNWFFYCLTWTAGLAAAMESLYTQIWQRWCESV